MNARKVTIEEIRLQHFASEDVLKTFEEKFERQHKLKTAMALTNSDHEEIKIKLKLKNGEIVEIYSNLIDFEDDYVEIKGGFGIPLIAIIDVGV